MRLSSIDRKLMGFSLIILLLSFVLHFLIPTSSQGWRSVSWHGVTYNFNVDSPEFARGVIDFPSERFFSDNIRVNRPLYIFIGWLIYKPLKLLKLDALIPSDLVDICGYYMGKAFTRADLWVSQYLPRDIILSWLSLVLVSAGLFVASFFMMGRLFLKLTSSLRLTFILMLILFFDFKLSLESIVWFPHTDAFDILIPTLVTYFCFKVYNDERSRYILFCSLMGVLMLGKGGFYGVLVTAFFPLFLRRVSLYKAIVGIFVCILPMLIYILFLKLLGYNYYNHEMETYRQGIWYLDILKGKGFWFLLEESLGKVRIILENALTAIRLGFGLLVVFLMFAFKRGISMKSEVIFRFCITYLVFGFLFWLWVGYTPVRLMFTFYPTVYLSLSYLIEEVLSFKQVEAISGNPSL